MFGWINDCTEKLVLSKFGLEKWHEIKARASINVRDGGFVRHQRYSDESTLQLVAAASEVVGIPVDGILEEFGKYFMEFVRAEGFENLLDCQGSTLRTWMSNINALHDHLESSFPRGMVKPVFWCEGDDDNEGTILLHYFSKRGNLLVPIVVGLVKEVARFHFNVAINMDMLKKQDVDGAKFTTWRVSAVDPIDSWKITVREKESSSSFEDSVRSFSPQGGTCPFSRMHIRPSTRMDDSRTAETTSITDASSTSADSSTVSEKLESSSALLRRASITKQTGNVIQSSSISLSSQKMKQIFPYHIVVDEDFTILQIGDNLPSLLETDETEMIGSNLKHMLKITKPVHGAWDWAALRKLEDQTFFMDPIRLNVDLMYVKLKGNMIKISSLPYQVMFVLSPDAKNVLELKEMKLTMSDLPLHSFQRDAVFLGEHIVSEVKSAHKLDRISKRLKHEKNLSNALLYSLLPQHVADELRSGNSVDPELHENVTMFFSDIVGFTNICGEIFPWDVIDMLNRLYCVMDFLAKKFNLYKVETVGDAYLCCSGLPHEDPRHAENIANFAIAVKYCCRQVLSPADGRPIQLRIGIHSGQCMSGVVGMSTPRYCVFGDMVNTTARHESTGAPDHIQVSSHTYGLLQHYRKTKEEGYHFTPRGFVDMKGKGQMFTYWLDGGTDANPFVNSQALQVLSQEVTQMLSRTRTKNKTYFKRYGRRGSDTVLVDGGFYATSEHSEANTETTGFTDESP